MASASIDSTTGREMLCKDLLVNETRRPMDKQQPYCNVDSGTSRVASGNRRTRASCTGIQTSSFERRVADAHAGPVHWDMCSQDKSAAHGSRFSDASGAAN
eukprot:6488525-Prymnesium_polylepis.2